MIHTEVEKVHRFVRGLIFSIRSYVLRSASEVSSFQTIVSIAKEAELMVQKEFGGPKRPEHLFIILELFR